MKRVATALAGIFLIAGCAIQNVRSGNLEKVAPESVGLSSSRL